MRADESVNSYMRSVDVLAWLSIFLLSSLESDDREVVMGTVYQV